jgi:Protein of unknown function (DUF2490)
MRTIGTLLLFLLGLCGSTTRVLAQSAVRSTSEQVHAWGTFTGNVTFDSSKVALYYDIQLRRADLGVHSQQSLNRIGALYQFNKNTSLGLGYAFAITSPYGDFPVKNTFHEHRIWEQFQHRQFFSRSNLTHRYRIEQRWLGDAAVGKFENSRIENRVRYFVRYQHTLRKSDHHPLYLNVFEEVMLNFGPAVTRNVFDQNRIGASLGLGLMPGLSVELGYLNQYLMQRGLTEAGLNKMENNHTLAATVVWNPKIR